MTQTPPFSSPVDKLTRRIDYAVTSRDPQTICDQVKDALEDLTQNNDSCLDPQLLRALDRTVSEGATRPDSVIAKFQEASGVSLFSSPDISLPDRRLVISPCDGSPSHNRNYCIPLVLSYILQNAILLAAHSF